MLATWTTDTTITLIVGILSVAVPSLGALFKVTRDISKMCGVIETKLADIEFRVVEVEHDVKDQSKRLTVLEVKAEDA